MKQIAGLPLARLLFLRLLIGEFPKRNQLAMCMSIIQLVVRCMSLVAPNRFTTLCMSGKQGVHLIGGEVGVRPRTLSHMLALPAQLRNSFWRSILEKKRSSTVAEQSACPWQAD
jgi:hypothetical protein